MALCTITGFVYMPNGQPARSRLFRFKPSKSVITAEDGGIIIPDVVDASTNSAGFLEVTLTTGSYTAFSTIYNGSIVVPEADTATLYEVFGGVGPVDPPVDVSPVFTSLPTLLGSTALGGVLTVNLGVATGSPEPVITGTLMRPGASPVAVTQGQLITVQAGDQGGSLSLTATATNSAGVDTETVSRAIPAAIPAPVFTTPLADVVLTVGDADVVVNLDDNTDNATSYSVSPAGGAVTISGSSMAVSAAAPVDQLYVVTATGPGGTATDSFGVLVEAAAPISYERIVVIGASQEQDLFDGPSPTVADPEASAEMGIPVFSLARGGVTIAGTNGGRAQITDALSRWPTPGETLFLIGSIAGNDITAVISGGLTDAEADTIATAYNSMLDLFGAHLPHVHALQTSFRSYTAHGFSGSELFDNPDLGSANLNDRLTPIFQARLNQSLYYANGDSMVDWYDLTRNNYVEWIEDGIHHFPAQLPTIRQLVTSRLRAALAGFPPAPVAPAPRSSLSVLLPSIDATDANVGSPYSYAAGRIFNLWDAPYTVTGLPAWATLSRNLLGQFTLTGSPTTAGAVNIEITATVNGITRVSNVVFDVTAEAIVYPALTTAAGTPAYTAGQFGQAMNSNGAFWARAANSLTPLTSAWGMEAWVRIPTVSRSNIFMGEAGSAVYGVVRASGSSPAGQACITYTGANAATIQLTGGPRIDNNAWHHVAVQFRSDGADLFVDGTLVASSAVAISATRPRDGAGTANDSRFTVGHYASTTAFIWSGQVDEVRIWDGLAMTAAFTPRTTAYTTLPAGTVAYWALDGNLTGGIAA